MKSLNIKKGLFVLFFSIYTLFSINPIYAQSTSEICNLAAPVKAGGPDPGALIEAKMSSQVGVLLDEIPAGPERERVANFILSQPDAYWIAKAREQAHFTDYNLEYRNWLYPHAGQLPLPDDTLWKITLTSKAERKAIPRPGPKSQALDMIVRNYNLATVILTDYYSPGQSAPTTANSGGLEKIGGVVSEPFQLPIDPTMFIQRTGRACVDEFQYALNSWDSVYPSAMYDQYCTAQSRKPQNSTDFDCYYCHCSDPYPELDCVQALDQYVGRTSTAMNFKRLAWNQSLADTWRYLPDGAPHKGSNLVAYTKDLKQNFEVYRYFPSTSPEAMERCISNPESGGWRKVIMFSATDYNNGKLPMHIGEVKYRVKTNEDYPPFILNNLFVFDTGHGHYHLNFYNQFDYVSSPSTGSVHADDETKRGFCLISVKRPVNAEWSPIFNPYFTCTYQGIASGWGDSYQVGIPCQWKDVTHVPPGLGTLTTDVNNWDMMCEGAVLCDSGTNEMLWEDTGLLSCSESTGQCALAQRPQCLHEADELNYLEDNGDSAQILHRAPGLSYVTDAQPLLGANQEIGPYKNTEFSLNGAQVRNCQYPGKSTVTLSCNIPNSEVTKSNSQVVRICESSRVLNAGSACRYEESLGNATVKPGSNATVVTFTCPAARDLQEYGGAYSLYISKLAKNAPSDKGDKAGNAQCTVVSEKINP
jgi:hypothetical protein